MEVIKCCKTCQFYIGRCIAYGGDVKYGRTVADPQKERNCIEWKLSFCTFMEMEGDR